MPGRLVMDAQNSLGSAGLKRDRSHADYAEGPDQKRMARDSPNPRADLNGSLTPASRPNGTSQENGVLTNGVSHHLTNGDQAAPALSDDPANRLPPELEHFSDSYVPFGKLLERMAQQAYFDLNETIDAMADMRVQDQPPAVNGTSSQPTNDTSSTSVDKKLRLMNYAQNQKDRFIKALVLADWGRNMDDMNKLIELCMWLRQQDEMSHLAADGIMRLKHNMIAAKMPNPNIEGALQVLSTGKAPWMPDLGYIPPKPLTASQLLKTLRDMNFTLSTRLNLSEDLPPFFNDYTIANGRATFQVPGEFEVDLATASEDPETPFYFIDIRLLFSPSSSFASDRLRTQLEGKVNELLATGGLQACYDFLHGFVLTHKLNVLYCQAQEMARSRWIDHVNVSLVHRSVVVQYWKRQPGGRNWIELGVVSGKGDKPRGGKPHHTPRISCRWFRKGHEVTDHDLYLDLEDLSMERILDQVVAKHTSGRLNALSDNLAILSRGGSAFSQELQTSETEGGDCSLRVLLKSAIQPVKVGIEPVTGSVSISPRTTIAADTEQRLNGETPADPGLAIRSLLCRQMRDEIVKKAQSIGWSLVQTEPQSNLKTVFGEEPVRQVAFQSPVWRSDLALAVSLDLQVPRWWIVQLGQGKVGMTILRADSLSVPAAITHLDRAFLSKVEARAIAEMSLSSVVKQLRRGDVPFNLQQTPDNETSVLISSAKLLQGKSTKTINNSFNSWCTELVSLTHVGLDDTLNGDTRIVHLLKGTLGSSAAHKLLPHVSSDLQSASGISFDERGAFEITLQTALGQPVLLVARSRLQALGRLCNFVAIATKYHFAILKASVSRLVFCYSHSPQLLAHLDLSDDQDITSKIRLRLFAQAECGQKSTVNPHDRIHQFLEPKLNSATLSNSVGLGQASEDFEYFCKLLRFTLPVLQTLSELESMDPYTRATFHCHDATSFKLEYRSPSLPMAFSIIARQRNDKVFWAVKDTSKGQAPSQTAYENLKSIWTSKGSGWTGLRNGAFAEGSGIDDLLRKIDGVVRHAKVEKRPQNAEGNVVARPNVQPQQQHMPQKAQVNKPVQNHRQNAEVVVLD